MRIARDLHDVVAHHVSVIAVQAEAAQSVMAVDPARAEKAMASVADTARAALTELRRLLGGLRADSALSPQPDTAALDELVDSVRRTGLAVTVQVDDEAAAVGGLVGVAAYRIVQEGLTNVLKHAHATRADVTVAVDGPCLVVTVTDDGRGVPPDGRSARADGAAARRGPGDRRHAGAGPRARRRPRGRAGRRAGAADCRWRSAVRAASRSRPEQAR